MTYVIYRGTHVVATRTNRKAAEVELERLALDAIKEQRCPVDEQGTIRNPYRIERRGTGT